MAEWLGYKVAAHPAVVAEWLALQFSKTSILLGPRFETCSGLHDAINSAHNGGTKCSVFFLNGAYASMKWTINDNGNPWTWCDNEIKKPFPFYSGYAAPLE